MLILAIGDIIGHPGRQAVKELLPGLRKQYGLDLVVANAENTAGGLGVTPSTAQELLAAGVDVLTSGNHIWAQKEIIPYLDGDMPILRPLNYPPGVPGRGYLVKGQALVVNLIGRTFMSNFDCPFRAMDQLLAELKNKPPVIIVDFHAEATSEKMAMGRYLDGRVSAVLGTHTHVGTIDAQLLPQGTAYVTDIGMTGPMNSVIGDDIQQVLQRFLTIIPNRLSVGKGKTMLNAILVRVDDQSGRAISIERIYREEAAPRVDLHLHSTASDGRFSPAEIVRKAAEAGLTGIALTDHDTVDGLAPALEAARALPHLKVIPGIEISTDVPQGEVHLLGYFIDYTHRELLANLDRMRNSRQQRAQAMIAKLKSLGLPIEWERVQEIAGSGSIGRPHIAQALLEKGYITSIKEAFTRYLSWGGPAYVARDKMTPLEAARLILQANGLPVLAHPLTFNDPEALVVELKAGGLVGIEAYYAGYTAEEIKKLVSLADKYGLIATGGTDYHGIDTSTETPIGGVDVPIASVEQLIALAEQRDLKLTGL